MKKLMLPALIALSVTACKNNTADKSYFDKAGMDTTVQPGDNFFMYANGTWIKNAKIPDDQSGWGSFYTLYDENLSKLKTILEETSAKTNHAKGSAAQKVGDFYASGMDTMGIEKKGYEPLKPMLAKIDAVKDYKELQTLLAEAETSGEGSLFSYYVGADEKNSAVNILSLYQSGTTLPEKDYYTKQDSITKNIRTKLVAHAAKYFELTGMAPADAQKNAASVLALETLLAASHLTPVEQRDPVKNYNKMSITDLQKHTPNIAWTANLEKIGAKVDSINVGQPKYYEALSNLLATQPIDVWKSKVKFDYISSNAALLTKAFRDERFKF
ncbi:MAG: M13 family metallopeptidase, partial [Chitinophagaceae bacterium]|nr:M13 family metallopeptidase [Chitinophagaceae bacterium]